MRAAHAGTASRAHAPRGRSALRTLDPWRLLRWLSIAVICASVLVAWRALPVEQLFGRTLRAMEDLGPEGLVVFGALYLLASLLLVPASILSLAAGALFGPWRGVLVVSVASTLAAAGAFLVARYLARDAVARAAKKRPAFAAVDRAIAGGGWRVVGLMRLSPLVPFSITNYLFGLTAVSFWPYVLASWAGMLPGALMFVWLGHAGGMALGGEAREKSPGEMWLMAAGLAATIAVTLLLARRARRELHGNHDHSGRGAGRASGGRVKPHRGRTIGLGGAALAAATFAACAYVYRERLADLLEPASERVGGAGERGGAVADHSCFDRSLDSEGSKEPAAGARDERADVSLATLRQ